MLEQKRGVSPLVATLLLLLMSVGLGAAVMSWGESYIEEKAEFVHGSREVALGCDSVEFHSIIVGEETKVCTIEDRVQVWIENGPGADLYDLHSRIVGSDDIYTKESLLEEPLIKGDSIKTEIAHYPIGTVKQVKLTPRISLDGKIILCSQNALVVEDIKPCRFE